jgi:hypothetical protein
LGNSAIINAIGARLTVPVAISAAQWPPKTKSAVSADQRDVVHALGLQLSHVGPFSFAPPSGFGSGMASLDPAGPSP